MEKDKGRGSVQFGGCGVLVIHFFGVTHFADTGKLVSLFTLGHSLSTG